MSRPRVLFVCFIINFIHFTRGQLFLQCACKMDVQKLSADCSGLGLTNISEIFNCVPNNTRELNLFNNSISDILPGIFGRFSSLQSLRLDYNRIGYLNSGVFSGLTQLGNLSLNHNNLNGSESYADDVFKPLRNLRRLYLQGNCNVHTSVCSYPDKAVSVATSLQYLHLDGIPNVDFGTGFSKLRNLETLYINDENGFCNLPVLTENTFEPFRQTPLYYLHLDGCSIEKFAPNVFRGLLNLSTLIIEDNRHLCSVENATVGLNETNIETIRFNNWCRQHSDFIRLAEGMFKGLTNTSLKTLDLGWNKINYIHPRCVDNLPKSLQYISLKENKLDSGNFLKYLRRLNRLEVFDVSYQYHNRMGIAAFRNRKLQANSLLQILKNTVGDDKPVYLPENVRTIFMNNIKLEYPVPSLIFGPNRLQHLDASCCMLIAFLGPWYGLKDLQFFNLSFNRFSYFSPNTFVDMGNLKTLLLQNTQIGESLNRDHEGLTFSSQKKLEVLDLRSNAIKDLPYKLFHNLTNLQSLSLAENSVKNISFLLRPLTKLRKLDLSNNSVEYISSENMLALDQIASTGKIDLDLSGNILSCMCNNQDFVNWLATTKVNIIQKDKLYCLYINETLVSLSGLEFIRDQLKYECTSWIVMTSCVTGFIGLLLVLSLVALLYHKRWQLRYLWYIGRVKIDPYHHPDDQEQALLEIDAYISYEQHYDVTDDITLHKAITDKIYPFFEERGYTLKIREQFDGYDKLYRVIPETIRKSRKVVVLLTPSYCKEYWNTFEFNIAAYEGIYSKRNVILPVVIGDLSKIYMTPEIRSFIRSKVKSKDVLCFPSSENYHRTIDAFNEQLEQWLCLRH
ncbi:toll-like receptor 4 [Mercenaria mercenaria]|uniref:toll-like receptor 4 n=1 Tax=Mercenaria mercenaria TaxID=6596 RepID=UPI00234F51B3|nr:toll-like receptor 4 [Mercenaria mercenaria]